MSITVTTLASALAEGDGQVNLASATGVTDPGRNKLNRVCLWVDRECLEVTGAPVSTTVPVVRAVNGTKRVGHAAGARVWIGTEGDFGAFTADGLGLGLYSSLSRLFHTTTPTTATDTATLTASQLLGGMLTGTPTAAANYTLPTAALLLAAMQAFCLVPFIGQSFTFSVRNTSAGNFTITMVAGTGGTAKGTMTVAQNAAKEFLIVVTGVDIPAFDIYSKGAVTF